MNEKIIKSSDSSGPRAFVRVGRLHGKAKLSESRFAFTRLVSTLIFLSILAAVLPKATVEGRAGIILIFVIFILAVAVFHKKLKQNLARWKALEESYALSIARKKRDLATIFREAAPWNSDMMEDKPAEHLYANDLDIYSAIFPLFNTCCTERGAKALFSLFLQMGFVENIDLKARERRIDRAEGISKHTRFIREHEALRLNSFYIDEIIKDKTIYQNSSVDFLTEYLTRKNFRLLSVFAFIGILLWAVLLIPAYVVFFRAGNSELLVHSLFIYTIVPFIIALVFAKFITNTERLSRETRPFELVLSLFSKMKTKKEFHDLSFFEQNAQASFKRLRLWLDLLAFRKNPILWLCVHALIPFDSLLCFVIMLEIRQMLAKFKRWQDDLIEFDLACAFARFAVENKHSHFFKEVDLNLHSEKALSTINMGHPLIPFADLVTNDFTMHKNTPVTLLTGSNMSGKSTFLRALGINLVLYNMGAPVCASFFYSPLRNIFCAIKIDDSLADGTSYFYAEVKRLKKILTLLEDAAQKQLPSLVFVDEIFRGTNNRERYIGSWNILKAFLEHNYEGIVTTHDLALTELSKRDSKLRNMHFRESIKDDKLVFDYTLKEGPCPTTNALFIMRHAGLPIPAADLDEKVL